MNLGTLRRGTWGKGNLGTLTKEGELGDTHKAHRPSKGTWGHSQSALTKRIGHRTLLLLIDSDTSNLPPQATRH